MTPWLLLFFASAQAGVLPVPIDTHTLENGLRIYLAPMDTPGVVSLQTWVSVGSGNETVPGTTGHAHFLEHLLFTDTQDWPATERDRLIRISGVEENAWTWLDDTVYHLTLPTAVLDPLIRFDGARFQRLLLNEATVQREAGAVQGEWRQGQSWPSEALIDGLYAQAFRSHPYGHSTIGTDEDVAAMPGAAPQIRAFMTTWYRPETFRIIVAGDFDAESTLALLTEVWGDWEGPEDPPPEIPAEPPQETLRHVEIPWSGGEANPRIAVGWRVPGVDLHDPDSAVLSILDELLLSDVAELHKELVEEKGLVYELGGRDFRFREPHLFLVTAELKPTTDPELVFSTIERHLEQVREGVEEERLDLVKERAIKRFRLGLDDPHRLAEAIGQATAMDPDPAALEAWFAAREAVTAEDLAAVVATYFVPEGRTQAVLFVEEPP